MGNQGRRLKFSLKSLMEKKSGHLKELIKMQPPSGVAKTSGPELNTCCAPDS